jgi:dTDP-4-dehydrorhamnose reductase
MSSPRNILVIGHHGMLGRAWMRLLEKRGVSHAGVDRDELDITDPNAVADRLTDAFDVVVNGAAYTDVDGAESDERAATRINGQAVGQLAERCAATGAQLVHYSTDYVFNGRANTPYPIDHAIDPVNAYGRSKADGEKRLADSGARHLLIRTSWLYAPWGKNFLRTIARACTEREALRVVDDQVGRPTSAEHLADASLKLLEREATGTFHVTDGGQCSWHEFACAIVATVNPDCRVRPCTSEEFVRPAPRPAYSVLDLSRAEDLLGPMPAWSDNLAQALAQMERART